MNSIVFENEIILYWDLPERYESGDIYTLYINGNKTKESTKTHIRADRLNPQTDYSIRIEHTDKRGVLKDILVDLEFTTRAEPKKINVMDYNASGDGKTLDTDALQRAIDDCQKGECVYFPKGIYLTGKLRLHSDMELLLEEGAVIKGSTRVEDYLPKISSRFEGYEMLCYSSLINMGEMDHGSGYNCENVIIRGGTICGGGKDLRENILMVERELMKEHMASLGDKIKTYENIDTIPGRSRPRLINMSNCKNIVIADSVLEYGPAWNVHMIYSEKIVTCGCKIRSHGVSNGDGWNPDSSANCTLFDTEFDTGDDMIAIKSGKNPEGNIIAKPSENIRIFDCRGRGNSCAIGSEMSGGVSDVYIWDCDFSSVLGGLMIKATPDRGGYVRNVFVKNTHLSAVNVYSRLTYNNDGDSAPGAPVFENFEFENLVIDGITGSCSTGEFSVGTAVCLSGFEEKGHELKNVRFKNIYLTKHEDGSGQIIDLTACRGISFENIVCE